MISIKTDITGVENGDTICSVWNSTDKKWVRILKDKDGNNINIYKLEVERSLNNGRNWILCLYKLNSKDKNQKHIFHLDLDVNFIFRVWQKSAFGQDDQMPQRS